MSKKALNVLFINSFPRSGSTLLGNLIGLHQDVRYLGEVRNAFPPDGVSIAESGISKESAYWKEVVDMIEQPYPLTRTSNKRIEKECYEAIRRLYQICADVADESWLVDSSHRTREVDSHIKAIGDNVRVIYLTRDNRAVLNSVLKRKKYRFVALPTLEYLFQRTKFEFGAYLFHRKLNSKNLLYLQYEQLCVDPLGTLKIISDFLGLEKLDLTGQNGDLTVSHIGGSSTFNGIQKNMSDITEDLSWQSELPRLPRILTTVLQNALRY